jgi:hypothetical protein
MSVRMKLDGTRTLRDAKPGRGIEHAGIQNPTQGIGFFSRLISYVRGAPNLAEALSDGNYLGANRFRFPMNRLLLRNETKNISVRQTVHILQVISNKKF